MIITLSPKKRFCKNLKKLPQKLQDKSKRCLKVFIKEPFHESLRRHKLKGKFKNYESLDVTGDLRIIIKPQTNEIIDIVDIGNHAKFYD